MSFGCERSCSSPRRVSNFNSKVPQGGLEDLGDTSVVSECSLGVNIVIDNFLLVASGTSSLHKIRKQSDH